MGKPLLNISSAASAFYRSGITVADFMREFCGIGQHKPAFTGTDITLLRSAFKGVRVSIPHEKNRIKMISDIGRVAQTPSGHRFTTATDLNISVAEHLQKFRSKFLHPRPSNYADITRSST